jgi:acetyl esterase/lipase
MRAIILRMLRLLFPLLLVAGLAAQTARYRDEVFAATNGQRNLVYGSAVDRWTNQPVTLRLDLYEPPGDAAPARPAVVVIHGGGFTGGNKSDPQMVALANVFARRGFVAISIAYRLAPPNTPITPQVVQDAMEDGKAAVRWLRANAATLRLDTDRIATCGTSAGAYTALAMAYVPGEGNSGNPGWPSHHHAVIDLWGALQDATVIDRGEPPVCIVHGTNDTTVPYARALQIVQRAQAIGHPYELHPLQGAGHAPWNLLPQFTPDMVAFLWERLRLGERAGLAAQPGWASPGTLKLDTFGSAADVVFLLASAGRADVALPFGRLLVDPALLVVLPPFPLAATPRLPAATTTLVVPAGIRGELHWQAVHVAGATPRLLTNAPTTGF